MNEIRDRPPASYSLDHHFFLQNSDKAIPRNSSYWQCRYALWFLKSRQIEVMLMPRGKSPQNNGFGVTFVTINLSEDDRKKFTGWETTLGDTWAEEFASYVSTGFKIGLTWDDANACFIASLTGKEEGTPNYNACITARSNDWVEALKLVHFKATVVCADGKWLNHQTSVAWG